MKKHLKIVSACAAALLAVAPVFTPVVSSVANAATTDSASAGTSTSSQTAVNNNGHSTDATKDSDVTGVKDNGQKTDTVNNGSDSSKATTDDNANHGSTDTNTVVGTVTVKSVVVAAGAPVFTPAAQASDVDLSGFGSGFTFNKFAPVVNIYKTKEDAEKVVKAGKADASKTVKNTDKLTNGTSYYEVAEITLNTPSANTKYRINNGIEDKDYMSDSNATVTIPVVFEIKAQSNAQEGQPFFTNAQNVTYANNQTVNAPEDMKDPSDSTGATVLAPTSVKNIAKIINNMGLKAYVGSASSDNILEKVTEDDVTAQLKKANITPDSDGNVTIPTGGFTYALTVKNNTNDKSATLNIFFKASDANYNPYPLIKMGKLNVAQGANTFNQNPVAVVSLHDKDWRANVLKQFTAVQSGLNSAPIDLTDSDLTVTSLDINHTGLYPATLKVTNKDGKSTYLAFNIGVQGDAKDETRTKIAVDNEDHTATSIKVYSIDGTKVTPVKDKTLPINSSVTVYNDEQTVNGVHYARLVVNGTKRADTNEWVRTDQLSDVPEKATEQGVTKKLMHAAYLYNAKGERVTKTVLKSYSFVPVVYKRVQIGKHEFYKIANSENYIKAGNIDPQLRKIVKNSYIYTYSGKIVTAKKNVTVRDKRTKKLRKQTKRVRLYYSANGENTNLNTYGAAFTIKVKTTKHGKTSIKKERMYRVAPDRYVLASSLRAVKKESPKVNS